MKTSDPTRVTFGEFIGIVIVSIFWVACLYGIVRLIAFICGQPF